MRISICLAALAFALAACGEQGDDEALDARETATPVEPDGSIGDGAPAPSAATSGDAEETGDAAGEGIPVGLQGRWGMVPADCTSTRGDAKGLLTVGPRTLTFYESVGTLALETGRSSSMIRGQFEFTGEGMTWTRDETLSVSGDMLTRTERGGEEPGGPFTYTRCL